MKLKTGNKKATTKNALQVFVVNKSVKKNDIATIAFICYSLRNKAYLPQKIELFYLVKLSVERVLPDDNVFSKLF